MKRAGLVMLLCCMLMMLTGCGCKHEHTTLNNAVAAGCMKEGYSGDLYCNDCQKVIRKGKVIDSMGHLPGEPVNVRESTCAFDGQTGRVYCMRCEALLKDSVRIPAMGHQMQKVHNEREATCIQEGYTGDMQCSVCGKITRGEKTPKTAHKPEGQASGIREATCTQEGYTGDRRCQVCGEIVWGEMIPCKEHQFVEHVCTVCEWRTPGMYINGKLEIPWDQLISAGFIKVKGNVLKETADSITGLLVVDESIERIERVRAGITFTREQNRLEEIYLPRSVKEIGSFAFDGCSIRSVRFFGNRLTQIGDCAFRECTYLEQVTWPETVTQINDGMFTGCTSLRSIEIPETVTSIEREAFRGCSALKQVKLPEHLKILGYRAFEGSGLESIDMPKGIELTYHANSLFKDCTKLAQVDLSGCTVASGTLCWTFYGCTSLKHVQFPEGTVSIENALYDCIALEELMLPEGLVKFEQNLSYTTKGRRNGEMSAVKRVVWPTTLIDGSELWKAAPNLKEIYYTGSQALWNLTKSKDMFTDVCLAYQYAYGDPFTNTDFQSYREKATLYEVTGFQKMRVEIAVDEKGIIRAFRVAEHNETPGFGADIIDKGFDALLGKDIATTQIDIRSGATLTSNAINEALKQAAQNALEAK